MLTRSTSVDVMAACFTCAGSTAIWVAKNAMAVAARHAQATGHETWADQNLSVRYKCEAVPDKPGRQ